MFDTPVKMVTQGAFGIKLIVTIIILIIHLEILEAGLRILGGRNSLKDEFPFAVRLELQYAVTVNGTTKLGYHRYCTGAALTPIWILTAAHCNDDEILKLRYYQLVTRKLKKFARYNSYFPDELGRLSLITEVLAHPSFAVMYGNPYIRVKNDIAMCKTENVLVSRYGKISAIDYTSFIGHEVLVLGFGGTNATPSEKPLQVLKGMLIKCDPREGQLYGMLCVVPHCGLDATICGGDSGGPVVHASGIVGINSVSAGNCNEHAHNLYPGRASAGIAMVSPVFDWISNIIANKSWYDGT